MVAYSFKRRFAEPILAGTKRQTIRAVGLRRHALPGDELQLYSGMRTKSCFLIGRARCVSVERVTLFFCAAGMDVMVAGNMLGPRQTREFARRDGFAGPAEMNLWWHEVHGAPAEWSGFVIRWDDFSPAKEKTP